MVEFQPSKLAVVGSNPIARSKLSVLDHWVRTESVRAETGYAECAHVAQLAEHVLGKDEVTRSIRVVGSMADCSAGYLSVPEGDLNIRD